MDYKELDFRGMTTQREWEVAETFPVLMRKVYVWMTLALAITSFTAYAVATSPGIMQAIYGNQAIVIGLFVAELALVFGVGAAINRLSLTTATLMFIAYSVINGIVFSSIFMVYTMTSIVSVFMITAGTFGAMAALGYTTSVDLSKWGGILAMALIGLIIATLVNVFLIKNSGLTVILNYAGVLIFVGLTAWDSQKIKRMLLEAPDAGETSQKIALLGALTLYLDFINLFIHLLRILGKRE